MSKQKAFHSALCIEGGAGGATLLVIGGRGDVERDAELLSNHSYPSEAERGGPWRWQKLPQMLEPRAFHPGMLLLGKGRVLVAGGWSETAKILQLPRDASDRGVWTLLTRPMTQELGETFLVNFNHRIIALSEPFLILNPSQA